MVQNKMKIKQMFIMGILGLGLVGLANAGAEVVVKLNTGQEFKWQFFDMQEASEFLADRINSGRCNPNIEMVRVYSKYIDGMDDVSNKFSWYHGITKDG